MNKEITYFEAIMRNFIGELAIKYDKFKWKDEHGIGKFENGKVYFKIMHEHDELHDKDTDDWEEYPNKGECLNDIVNTIDEIIEALLKDGKPCIIGFSLNNSCII